MARTANCPHTIVRDSVRPLYGLQFHPEVHHTTHGNQILENFVLKICAAEPTWRMSSFVESETAKIRELLASPDQRDELGRRARACIEGAKGATDRYLKMLEKILSETRKE